MVSGPHMECSSIHLDSTQDKLHKGLEQLGTPYESTWIPHRNNSNKDFQHTWNIPGTYLESIEIPPRFHLRPTWKHLENIWKKPGTYLESTQIPPRFHLRPTGKHLENTWNIPGIHMNPLKFHPGSTLDQLQCFPGIHLEFTWNQHGLLGFHLESHTLCGMDWNSMELPWNMWNQCGFHVDRWGSVNCWQHVLTLAVTCCNTCSTTLCIVH